MSKFNKIDNFIIEKADILVFKNISENISEINNELFNNNKPDFDRILNLFILEFSKEEIILETFCKNMHSVEKCNISNNKYSIKDILNDNYSRNKIIFNTIDNDNYSEMNISEDNSLQVLFKLFIFILNHEGLSIEILLKHFSIDKIMGLIIFILYKNRFIKSIIFEIFNRILLKINRTKNYQIYKILEYFQSLEKNNIEIINYEKNNHYEYFMKIILTGLMICESNISFKIIKKMIQLDEKLILYSLKYFSNTFSIQQTDIQVNIILFLEFINEFKVTYTKYFIKILEETVASRNSFVINQFYLLFNNKKVFEFIHINIGKLLSKVFENLYRNSKRSWSVKERIEYSYILDFFVTLDPETFKKSLIIYNKKNS